MLSKNMSLSLFSLATMMSFNTGYANDSLKDAQIKGLICVFIGGCASRIIKEGTGNESTALATGKAVAILTCVDYQIWKKLNDELSMKSLLTQGLFTLAGCFVFFRV